MYTLISNLKMFLPSESVIVKTVDSPSAIKHLVGLGYNIINSQHDNYIDAFRMKKMNDARIVRTVKLINTYKFEQIISKLEEESSGEPNAYVWENFMFGYNIASKSVLDLIQLADSAGAVIQRGVQNDDTCSKFSGDYALVKIDLSLIPEFNINEFIEKQSSANFIDYVISEYHKYDNILVLKSFEKERYLLSKSIRNFKGSSYKGEVPQVFEFKDCSFFDSMIKTQ